MLNLGADDFALAACQASVYTPDGELAVARLFRDLLPSWSSHFDTEPQVVPHPTSRHPRVLLRSGTGMWRCEIAADRTDFYWIRPEPRAPAPAVEDFFTIAGGMLAQYAAHARSRVGRMAAVVSRVATHAAPARFLVQHYARPQLAAGLEGTESFELNTGKRYALGGRFLVNALMRCRTPSDNGPGTPGAVLLDQDLNTLADRAPAEQFDADDLATFFPLAARDHAFALATMFPTSPE